MSDPAAEATGVEPTGNPIEKRLILPFGQAMLLGLYAIIGIISSIGLGDEDSALRVDRQSIQECS